MLRFSVSFFVFLIFVLIITLSSFWSFNFVRFDEASSDRVLGSSIQKNLSLKVRRYESYEVVNIKTVTYRNQRTVYHGFYQISNTDAVPRKFILLNTKVINSQAPISSYEVAFFYRDKSSYEVTLEPGEEVRLDLEINSAYFEKPFFDVELEAAIHYR